MISHMEGRLKVKFKVNHEVNYATVAKFNIYAGENYSCWMEGVYFMAGYPHNYTGSYATFSFSSIS